ncbi:MAG: effector binding domain-containing protein [Verrucomicrobia bacterium]|nr:effector binding domain-containing protein [Verrucomicrobiota bacterium]
MRRFLGIFLWLCIAVSVYAADVTVVVRSPSVPKGATVYIAGGNPTLGNWEADAVPLKSLMDGSWSGAFSFEPGETIAFKLTLGHWMLEALDENGEVPSDHIVAVSGDTNIVIEVPAWNHDGQLPEGGVTGTVEYHRDFAGEGILPRDILVWLPPGYSAESDTRYPVLYMHDGQQIFDPFTSTHNIDWQIDETATRLIEDGKMKEIIVVGATCTADRSDEYGYTDKGKLYRRFMVETLKPFIDETYRTLPDRENTAIAGSSMGGIASFLLAWEYPDVFSKAGCFSPAFWLDFDAVEKSEWPKQPARIYIDNGGQGIERRLQPGCDLMLDVLRKKGFVLGDNLVWFQNPEAEHNEAAWAERAWRALLYFFGTQPNEWIDELPPPPRPMYAERDKEPNQVVVMDGFKAIGFVNETQRWRMEDNYDSLWAEFRKRAAEVNDIRHPQFPEYVGITRDKEDGKVEYLAGVIVTDRAEIPESMVAWDVPENFYLVFKHQPANGDLGETMSYIWNWYLYRHGFKYSKEDRFELLRFDGAGSAADAVTRIMIPID